jgi:phenylacetate-CoA ligase
MLLSYHPERTFIEIVDPDEERYGAMAISMLDPARQIPLLRYQTGDVARVVDRTRVIEALREHGTTVDRIPGSLLALRGRAREGLPNGSHVGLYKDALYANPDLARRFTGATRLVFTGARFTMHAQLARGQSSSVALEGALAREIPVPVRPARIRLWEYARFPFGMTLDYERKFQHHAPGDADPD